MTPYKQERERVRAAIKADPSIRCKYCGLPLARCRQLLKLDSPATHAAIVVCPEPEPVAKTVKTAPAKFTESLFG